MCYTEVVNMLSLGRGVYTYTLRGPVDRLDINAVFGLFTWDDGAPEANYREIDVELARWGDPAAPNAQYVIQPYTTAGNLHRFSLTLPDPRSRHVVRWRADAIDFRTEVEDTQSPGVWSSVHEWTYTGASNPAPGLENPRINFWLQDGQAPADGLAAELVVEGFEFAADGAPTAVLNVYRNGTGDGGFPAGTTVTLINVTGAQYGIPPALVVLQSSLAAIPAYLGDCVVPGACQVAMTSSITIKVLPPELYLPLLRQ